MYCISENAECVSSYHVQNSWTPPKTGPPKGGGVAESTSVFYEAELREINNILTRRTCYDRQAALICLYSTAVIAEEQYSSHYMYIRTEQKTEIRKNSMVTIHKEEHIRTIQPLLHNNSTSDGS